MTTGIVYSRGVPLPDDEDAFAVGVDALLPRTAEPMLYDWEMADRAKNEVATASMPVQVIQNYVSRSNYTTHAMLSVWGINKFQRRAHVQLRMYGLGLDIEQGHIAWSFTINIAATALASQAIISFSRCLSAMFTSSFLRRQLRFYSSIPDHRRPTSIGFIGLGRMGCEMAYNLFSKTYKDSTDSQFVVCDAIPESARSFSDSFLKEFPGASVRIARTPEE